VVGLGVLAVVLAGLAGWGWLRPEPAPVVTASYIKFAPREAPLPGPVDGALSRDGTMLVYAGPGEGGRGSSRLWIKRRGELHPTAIAGTDGAQAPMFSPDSRWIAFFADGRLKKIPSGGGGVVTLADAPTTFRWGAWLEGGRIVFAGPAFSLLMVGEDGGAAETVVSPADIGPGRGAVFAIPLPGGRGFLFASCGTNCSPTDIWVMDLGTRKATLVLKDAFPASLVPTGELLYTPGTGVMLAAPFDLGSLTLTGPGRPVVEGLARFGIFAVADDGTLVYQESGGPGSASIPVWVTRDGRETPIDSSWSGDVNSVALSPNGKRLAITAISGQTEDVWVKELDRGPLAKITFGEEPYNRVRWSSDGSSVFYLGGAEVLAKHADGTGAASVRTPGGRKIWSEVEESRDGKWLILRSLDGGKRDIWALATGDTVVRPLLTSDADEFSPTLSPDGKWLAFAGQEGAITQVFVTPFPEVGSAKWQVSTDGGGEPVWSHDGRELFYVRNSTELMVAEVNTAGAFSVLSRKTLFSVGPYARDLAHRIYDVTPDGQRFVMIRTTSFATGDLVMIENWFAVLKEKLRR
jgi:serine/threonine-protein kinase